MSLRVMVTALLVLTALNVLALSINLAQQSKSAPMSYQELMRDPDFTRAVKSVTETCAVNIELAKLRC